jgi:uncharacterized protein (TIGR02453 family)
MDAQGLRFDGIPPEAFEFYASLAVNNSRPWWAEHKVQYERFVKEPLTALLNELSGEFGDGHLYRPYRDTRFSKDKTPLKDHQGALVAIEDSVGYYLQVSATGVMVAGGWYAPQGRQIERYRNAVDGPRGPELERILAGLPRAFAIEGQPLKTRPRGFDADHPRIDLLRNRALTAARTHPPAAWLGTRKALTTVRADWRAMRPLLEWLADNVGPGADPADG